MKIWDVKIQKLLQKMFKLGRMGSLLGQTRERCSLLPDNETAHNQLDPFESTLRLATTFGFVFLEGNEVVERCLDDFSELF